MEKVARGYILIWGNYGCNSIVGWNIISRSTIEDAWCNDVQYKGSLSDGHRVMICLTGGIINPLLPLSSTANLHICMYGSSGSVVESQPCGTD